jgi:hypothetical protein
MTPEARRIVAGRDPARAGDAEHGLQADGRHGVTRGHRSGFW